VRTGGGRVMAEGDAAGDDDPADYALDAADMSDEVDSPIRLPGVGTQIAA
jgi:hypothetical protein